MQIEYKNSEILSSSECRRFQHQLNLPQVGLEGQEKIKRARVLVIGAGGIGAQVLQFLAATGVGNLAIVDDELVSERNIQLQTLYGGNDLGKLKTIISRQQLQNLYPLTKFDIINLKLTENNIFNFLDDYSVIVDATNTQESHYLINDACIKLKKIWVYGHVNSFAGEVSVFNSQLNYTYRKLYPEPDGEKNFGFASSLAVTYGTIGCLMASEAVKLILESPQVLTGKVLNINLFNNIFVYQDIP